MHVTVKVKAGARKESVKEVSPERFEISVREEAEHNQANLRIVDILAERFGVPVKCIRMIKGHRTSSKMFTISIPL